MAKYISNRQDKLRIGISSYTESNTVLEVTGKVGIGTTNASTNLDINGGIRLRGALLDKDNQSGTSGQVLISTGSGVDWADAASSSAISGITILEEGSIVGTAGSVSSVNFVGPNVTATASGAGATITIADYVSNAGIATFATNAGISTNLKGGLVGNIPYQSAADTTVFLANGSSGTILQSNGVGNVPTWVTAAPSGAITGLTVRDEGTIVGGANSVSQFDFVGSNISVASTAGIATITIADNLVGTALSISGITTTGTLNVGTGGTIITTTTGGLVGIKTTSPQSALDVRGTISIGRTDTTTVNTIRSVTDINSWEYAGVFDSVAEDTAPSDLYFSTDGTKMFILGDTGNDVNEYTLSTAWDVNTATFTTNFLVSSQETAPSGLYFKPDGTRMYICGQTGVAPTGDRVYSYTLSNPWSLVGVTTDTVAGAGTTVKNFNVGAQDTAPNGVYFKDDGLKMYVVGSTGDAVYEYSLSIAWELDSTITLLNTLLLGATNTLNLPLSLTTPTGIDFNTSGTKMYITDNIRDVVARFDLATPWDTTTTTFYDNVYVGFQELTPNGIFYQEDQSKAYIVGSSNDTVYQFNTDVPSLELASSGITTRSSVIINNEARLNNRLYVTGDTHISGNTNVKGTLTADGTINAVTLNITSAIDLADSDILRFGSSDDWEFFHNGTHNYMDLNVGDLIIRDNTTTRFIFERTTGNLLLGSSSSTGTANQKLQVTGGAYVSSRLGVGNTNPSYDIDVTGSVGITTTSGDVLILSSTNASARTSIVLNTNGNDWEISARSSAASAPANSFYIYDKTGAAYRQVIDPSGNVLLGGATAATGTASQPLQVTGGAYVSGSVGIGVTNPQDELHLGGTSNVGIRLEDTAPAGGSYATIGYNDNGSGTNALSLNADAGNTGANSEIRFAIDGNDVSRYAVGGELLVGAALTTGTASQLLQVSGGAYVSGSVAIGTTNPLYKLDVNGNLRFTPNSKGYIVGNNSIQNGLDGSFLMIAAGAGGTDVGVQLRGGTSATSDWSIYQRSSDNSLRIRADDTTEPFVITNPGNIGIGSINPTSKLSVVGDGNFTGVVTATQFSTGASGTGINITTNTISGPAELTIDPAAVGDNTGSVRIKGDLYVDGTQFVVNSTTIELADFNVGIATTVGTNALLDGAGIGIGSTGIRKFITWNNSASALTSSEDWNLVTGKQYEINGTPVLSSTTLGSDVVNSSLTSVGTLGQLNVSGVSTFTNGPLLVGSATSTGTASQLLQVTGGAYVSGNLGIGTTNPQDTLDVGLGTIRLYNKSIPSRYSQIYQDNALTFKNSSGGDDFDFYQGTSLLMRLFGGGELVVGSNSRTGTASQLLQVNSGGYFNGSVGIGTTNPTSKLNVIGNALITGIVTASSFNDYQTLVGTTSSATKTFTVTVASKTTNHRYYGNGSGSAYFIDGAESPFITLLPGKTYRFNQEDSSNSTHPLRFYLESNRTTQYSTNVTTNGTAGNAGAYTEITIIDTTPIVLHYQCSSHAYMGNAVSINSNFVDTPYQITARSGINVTGVVTATSFSGLLTGNVTGTATTATNLADAANITTGTINSARLSGTYDINVSYASTAGIATVAQGLTGAPNIVVGVVTATSFVKSDGTSSQFLKADGSVDTSTYLTSYSETDTLNSVTGRGNSTANGISVGILTATSGNFSGIVTSSGANISGAVTATNFVGSGINLTGIVTSIVAGSNITISGSTGQVTINSSGGSGGSSIKNVNTYTATEGQTTFSANYSVGYVDIYLNGVKLSQYQYTATNGTSIVLIDGASLDDVVEIVGFVTNAASLGGGGGAAAALDILEVMMFA